MRNHLLYTWITGIFLLIASSGMSAPLPDDQPQKVQIALLLDTSGSMDDLLDHAKANFWFMVDEIMSNYDGYYMPEVEVALYEYGRNGLGRENAFIRMVTPLTYDLDWVSDELYRLEARNDLFREDFEYCGEAIMRAAQELDWSYSRNDLKMIFIAGNESFTQGRTSYTRAIDQAVDRGIIVNTIFAGDYSKGVYLKWEKAAHLGYGQYSNLDFNHSGDYYHYETYYDSDIIALNEYYNNTYIPYGADGYTYWDRSIRQDRYARNSGNVYICVRTIVKTRPWYNRYRWDLINALDHGWVRIEHIHDNDLPPYLRGLTLAEKRAIIEKKRRERENYRNQILTLSQSRREEVRKKEYRRVDTNPRGAGIDRIVSQSVNQRAVRQPDPNPGARQERYQNPANRYERPNQNRNELENRNRQDEINRERREAEVIQQRNRQDEINRERREAEVIQQRQRQDEINRERREAEVIQQRNRQDEINRERREAEV
ncbi:MAG: hypothetical protein KDE26_23060, partial [Bacteroidetes bacterium]|nr:hypothetical protein [Bacteroidota bacterium]